MRDITMPRDPSRRAGVLKAIAATDIFIGVSTLIFHTWSFVLTLRDPSRLESSGQPEAIVYIGIVFMTLISLILILISLKVFLAVAKISSHPVETVKVFKAWKRWLACFLAFFGMSLMIIVLSSEKQVHEKMIQNYMAFLLTLIAFTIYGIYYMGCTIKEMEAYNGLNPVVISAPANDIPIPSSYQP